jgi:hypothetical protein
MTCDGREELVRKAGLYLQHLRTVENTELGESEDFHSQQLAMFEPRGSLVGEKNNAKEESRSILVRYAKIKR